MDCIHRNGDITGYVVKYREVGSFMAVPITMSFSGREVVEISKLSKLMKYNFQVAARTSAGRGLFSPTVTVATPNSEFALRHIV